MQKQGCVNVSLPRKDLIQIDVCSVGGRQLRATRQSLEQARKRAGDAIAREGLHFGLC